MKTCEYIGAANKIPCGKSPVVGRYMGARVCKYHADYCKRTWGELSFKAFRVRKPAPAGGEARP